MYVVEPTFPASGMRLPTASAGTHDEGVILARRKIRGLTKLGWVLVAYAEPINRPEGHLRIFEARNGTRIEVRLRPIAGGPCCTCPANRSCEEEA